MSERFPYYWMQYDSKYSDACFDFLIKREKNCVNAVSSFLFYKNQLLPLKKPIYLWINKNNKKISAVLIFSPSGSVLPVIKDTVSDQKFLTQLGMLFAFNIPRFFSTMGIKGQIDLVLKAIRMKLYHRVEYRTLCLDKVKGTDHIKKLAMEVTEDDFTVRRLFTSDIEQILDLQIAYEKEEVLIPGHHISPSFTEKQLRKNLKIHYIYGLFVNGILKAKVSTNSLGYNYDQVGGVYTIPEDRNKGLATILMYHLIHDIFSRKKSVSLFVKTKNTSALGLYDKLGFEDNGLFSIAYFS